MYDRLVRDQDDQGIVQRELNAVNPDEPRWWWVLHGSRSHWWLEIHDDRIPELAGKAYYLDPMGDPSFFPTATSILETDDELNTFLVSIVTAMDEHLLGQTEALRAYKDAPNAIPWIHTDGAP
ncbi:hypothetical protein [Sulfobacillus harzensis]|uniref:Uncharacterized protein n=1 Tax=Sulfobacillus harzensis TaxID=2729629 RepID=A0A7Y0L759_9FIRM|nr:hypothetical protein [Sulfobacillus harzensis]NMP24475.1 hypothetical protein [Sulfobacillus harzensis]